MVDRSNRTIIWAHCSEYALDTPSEPPWFCHIIHRTTRNVGEFGLGEVLQVDVDLTTVNTLVKFWVRPLKRLAPSMPQEGWETVNMYAGLASCCHSSHSQNLRESAAPQERCVHEKINLPNTNLFWRGLLRQQKPLASNLAFFSARQFPRC